MAAAAAGLSWKSVVGGLGLGDGFASAAWLGGCFGQIYTDMWLQRVAAVSSSFTVDLIHEDSPQVQHHHRWSQVGWMSGSGFLQPQDRGQTTEVCSGVFEITAG